MKKVLKICLVVIFVLVLFFGGWFFTREYYNTNRIVTVITMDINPSIEISLNKKAKVVKVIGLNDDGKNILKSNDFKGNNLNEAIDGISTSLIEQEYLIGEENIILINVTGEVIKEEVTSIISTTLKDKEIECDVIYEEITEEDREEAKKYGISASKSSYIEKIVESNDDLNFEDLKDKSIKEINEIVEKKQEQIRIDEEAEQKRLAEEKKKAEEQKAQQGSDNRHGSISQCESVKANFSREDAIKAVFSYVGLDYNNQGNAYYQTMSALYNNICTYETKITHNKTFYKFYHSIADGKLIHREQTPWVICGYSDLVDATKKYFVETYGSSLDDVQVLSGSVNINESVSQVKAVYNDESYSLVIYKKTGLVKSVNKTK